MALRKIRRPCPRQRLKTILSGRPFAFLVAGALLYLSYAVVGENRVKTIALTEAEIGFLSALGEDEPFEPTPTADTVRLLAMAQLRQKVLVDAAKRAGLDQGDLIIDRRLAQKMQLLLTPPIQSFVPADGVLEAFLSTHASRYRIPGTIRFTHHFFADDKGLSCQQAALALERIKQGQPIDSQPFMLGHVFTLTLEQIKQQFGADFAQAVRQVPLDQWSSPMASRFGCHLVMVTARTPDTIPAVAAIKARLVADWQQEEQKLAQKKALCDLFQQYHMQTPPSLKITPHDLCASLD